jgi:hypothetical protein
MDPMEDNQYEIFFSPNAEGWEKAKAWAKTKKAPETSSYDNLWEYTNAVYRDSFEALAFIDKQYKKDVNNSGQLSFEF